MVGALTLSLSLSLSRGGLPWHARRLSRSSVWQFERVNVLARDSLAMQLFRGEGEEGGEYVAACSSISGL